MCVAYIFTKLWTGKFFGFLARSSDREKLRIDFIICNMPQHQQRERERKMIPRTLNPGASKASAGT